MSPDWHMNGILMGIFSFPLKLLSFQNQFLLHGCAQLCSHWKKLPHVSAAVGNFDSSCHSSQWPWPDKFQLQSCSIKGQHHLSLPTSYGCCDHDLRHFHSVVKMIVVFRVPPPEFDVSSAALHPSKITLSSVSDAQAHFMNPSYNVLTDEVLNCSWHG